MRRYSTEQVDYCREIAPGRGSREILSLMIERFPELTSMTLGELKSFKKNNKIKSGKLVRSSKYTNEQKEFLRQIVPGNTDRFVITEFNKNFGILLTKGTLGNIKRRLHIKNGLIGGRFEKRHPSWNKGKKWADFMPKEAQKKSLMTCYKKGHIPANRSEIGVEGITKDGYVKVKIQDGHKNGNWVCKHRLVWEEVNGPIPHGYNVVFLDGDKRNFGLENLALVSKSENLIMNQKKLFSNNAAVTKSGSILAKVICRRNKLRKEKANNGR